MGGASALPRRIHLPEKLCTDSPSLLLFAICLGCLYWLGRKNLLTRIPFSAPRRSSWSDTPYLPFLRAPLCCFWNSLALRFLVIPVLSSAFSCIPSYNSACFLAMGSTGRLPTPMGFHLSAPGAPEGWIHLAIRPCLSFGPATYFTSRNR